MRPLSVFVATTMPCARSYGGRWPSRIACVPASNILLGRGAWLLEDRPGPPGAGPYPPRHAHDRPSRAGAGICACASAPSRASLSASRWPEHDGDAWSVSPGSRIAIEHSCPPAGAGQAAHMMDTVGNKFRPLWKSRRSRCWRPQHGLQGMIDWAIQAHGGGGMSDDFPLAYAYAHARTIRLGRRPG